LTPAALREIVNHMVNYKTDRLDRTFGALADPTRRAILARLADGEASVTELAEPFRVSLPAVSKHLRILEDAGLLTRTIDGRVHRCRVNAAPMQAAAEWIERYRAFWDSRLDALADYLANTTKEQQPWPSPPPSRRSRSPSGAPTMHRAKKSSRPGSTRKR
jgi:DNA-binding transcriptional ArsR family regulator